MTLMRTPATDEGALDAVNKALEAEGVPTTEESDADDDVGAGASGEAGEKGGTPGSGERGTAAGDDADAGAAEGAGKSAATKGAKGANGADDAADPEADRGDGRNARGEFIKKSDETDEAFEKRKAAPDSKGTKPEADAGTGKPKTGGKKAPDYINDPIPDDIQGRTRTRIEGLIGVAKTITTERDTLKAENTELHDFVNAIHETGASPETFARHMDVLRLMHSNNAADKRQVLTYLTKARDKFAAELGETPAGKDPLEGHQDLIDEVDAGELRRDRAIEVAQQRNRAKAETKLTTDEREQQQREEAARDTAEKLRTELNALTDELKRKDGALLYARKHEILVPIVKRLRDSIAPDQMVAAVREAYANIKLSAADVPRVGDGGRPRVPAGTGAQQPARARHGAGAGGAKAPTSGLEAIELGLSQEAASRGRG